MTDKFTFKTSDDLGKTIRDLADSDHEGSLSQALNHLVAKALNRYASLDTENVCDSLAYEKDDYRCVWGRIGKTPDIKKIGTTERMKDEICSACNKTIAMKEKLFTMEQRIAKGIIVDIPSCKHGGQLSEDGKKLYCKNPHMTAQYRDVEKWCKVVRNKANCESLKWTRIAVKGKLPDGQNL